MNAVKTLTGFALTKTGNPADFPVLQRQLVSISVFNLLLVSVIGVALRIYPHASIPFIAYKNLLHAHSHFAFAGWIMPVLQAIIIKFFPELVARVPAGHLRNITFLLLVSAYGMLLSFPFQGYGPVSILFSTISVMAGFYLAVVTWKAARTMNETPVLFLKSGLFFLVLSAIGPFATGPLAAMKMAGSAFYYNAIYFYLHFQYNGWFTFALLAVLYKVAHSRKTLRNDRLVYWLFVVACLPAFFLSILWSRPHNVFYIIGGVAAIIQLAGVLFLLTDMRQAFSRKTVSDRLFQIVIVLLVLKSVLQLASALPPVADFAYQHRNLAIAYLHMVLLGFISLGAFAAVYEGTIGDTEKRLKKAFALFIAAFLFTEIILVTSHLGLYPASGLFSAVNLLAVVSVLLPISLFIIWSQSKKL